MLSVLVALTGACSQKKTASQAFTVQMDASAGGYNGVFTAFFPADLSVHPGDAVTFTLSAYHGEPHSVAMGKMIDTAIAQVNKLGGGASLEAKENTNEMTLIPAVFPRFYSKVRGDLIPNLSAVNPCFLPTEQPPNSLTGAALGCSPAKQPDFDGRQSFFSLGLFATDHQSATVRIAKDAEPGTYTYMCLVHRTRMIGHLTIKPAKKPVISAEQQSKLTPSLVSAMSATLGLVTKTLAAASPDKALAGVSVPATGGLIAQFGPPDAAIRTGQTMSWTLTGDHSIAFGVPDSWIGLIKKLPGGYDFNRDAFKRVGAPMPPLSTLDWPPPDNGVPIVYDAGTYAGSGMFSTGLLHSQPPVIVTVTIKFSKAGSFDYRCTVHPGMRGRVTVR